MNRPGHVTEPPDRAVTEPPPSQPPPPVASPAAKPPRLRRLRDDGEPPKTRHRGLQKPEDIPTRLVPLRSKVETGLAEPPPPWDFLRILARLVHWALRALILHPRNAKEFTIPEKAKKK